MSKRHSLEEGEISEHDSVMEYEQWRVDGQEPEAISREPLKDPPVPTPTRTSIRSPENASCSLPSGSLRSMLFQESGHSAKEVSEQFLREVASKHCKANAEYKLLFARWKRQPIAAGDCYGIPEWNAQDGNDILRWEFSHNSVEKTVWNPLFNIMKAELQSASEEIEGGKLDFANITLGTVDGLLDSSLAHNKKLRAALVNVECPTPALPEKTFVAAKIDLSEFDNIDRERGDGRRSGREAQYGRTGEDQGRRAPSRAPDDQRRNRGDIRRPNLRRRRSGGAERQ